MRLCVMPVAHALEFMMQSFCSSSVSGGVLVGAPGRKSECAAHAAVCAVTARKGQGEKGEDSGKVGQLGDFFQIPVPGSILPSLFFPYVCFPIFLF